MGRTERNALSILSAAVAVFALVVAGIAVAVSNNNSGGGGSGSGGGSSTPNVVTVILNEFNIEPKAIHVPAGNVKLDVRNAGSLEHNLAIDGGPSTPNLKPGESFTLDLGEMQEGEFYDVLCTIAGHANSGMTGTLTVDPPGTPVGGAGDGGTAATTVPGSGVTGGVTVEQMDAAMDQVVEDFLKVNGLHPTGERIEIDSFGNENPDLEYKLVNGVKEFELTSKVVDWEVEPGKFVKAWTYNGIVPGPVIRVDPGDKIKITLKNELPESTTLHPHGCSVPNAMDGFDPITQKAIKPGESFVYEWTIPTGKTPRVCMYHSHHNAQVQVPNGLVGALIISGLEIPGGIVPEHEVIMTLNDAGTIGLALNGRSFPATQGYVVKTGETMLVHYYNEGLQIHPMHLHAPHALVFAKDGYELPQPYYSDTVNVAPGERYSVLYTFDNPGVWAWHCHILTHAETPQGFRYMTTAVVVQD
jgi:manganese oxidase